MNDAHWDQFLAAITGEKLDRPLVRLIVDGPWLPGWAGRTILDYYTSEQLWLEIHFRAIDTFPEVIFLPGFWSEFGMCTEPSAFGCKCVFQETELPHADKLIEDIANAARLKKPNPHTD